MKVPAHAPTATAVNMQVTVPGKSPINVASAFAYDAVICSVSAVTGVHR